MTKFVFVVEFFVFEISLPADELVPVDTNPDKKGQSIEFGITQLY